MARRWQVRGIPRVRQICRNSSRRCAIASERMRSTLLYSTIRIAILARGSNVTRPPKPRPGGPLLVWRPLLAEILLQGGADLPPEIDQGPVVWVGDREPRRRAPQELLPRALGEGEAQILHRAHPGAVVAALLEARRDALAPHLDGHRVANPH